MKIGFIGLGKMGLPMAKNILEAGYALTVYNRTASKADDLVAAGAQRVYSPQEALTPGQIVVTMLTDDAALEEIASNAFMQQLGDGGIHLSMSTVSASVSRRLAEKHTKSGNVYLAAPVFGPPAAAAARKLWVCLSGPADAKARVQPLLTTMSQGIYDFGQDPGAANIAKLSGNFMLQAALEAMAEGIALADKHGLDRTAFISMLSQTIFNCPVYQNYGGKIAAKRFNDITFSFANAAKDNRLIRQAAEDVSISLPLVDLLKHRFVTGMIKQRSNMDMTAIALGTEEDAGSA